MKIVVFNSSFFPLSQTFIFTQIKELSKKYQILMLGEIKENPGNFPLPGVPFIKLEKKFLDKVKDKFIKKDSFSLSPLTEVKLRRILIREKPDLIHAHFGPNGIKIFQAAKACGVPYMVTFHGFDASPASLINPEYKEKISEVIKYANKILVVSPHMVDTLGIRRYKKKVEWIPCGIDTEIFSRATGYPIREGKIKLLHVGRLTGKKGVPDLIRVVLELSKEYDIELEVIGDGPEMEFCQELLKDSYKKTVKLLGSKSSKEVRDKLEEAHIFILNSRTADDGDMEGIPNGILEAMSMEIPVISTNHAGIPYVIESGVSGILVPEKNNESLKKAITKLINDEVLCQQIRLKGRNRVVKNFSLKNTVSGLQNIIENIYK